LPFLISPTNPSHYPGEEEPDLKKKEEEEIKIFNCKDWEEK